MCLDPSLNYRENWSQVTGPLTAFLAKNQLASDGPTAMKPVVLVSVDSRLTRHKSLCPVWALKYLGWIKQKISDTTRSFVLLPLRKFSYETYLLATISFGLSLVLPYEMSLWCLIIGVG